ncbi:MAG: hypothetical protein HY698_15275 [Deltaproteobacteria bacterium]|nr:hypothetical protein [Deltaproteobacteria bacterium]
MLRPLKFPDRIAAGRALAPRVLEFTAAPSVVLGVPNGGVLVAAPIAESLAAPLCVAWVRKVVSPAEPDVVLGAVDLDGDMTVATEIVRAEGLSDETLAEVAYHAHQHLLAQWERMPGLDASSLLAGTTAIVVDDLICTGMSLRAAMRWARKHFVRTVVLAVPVVDGRTWHRVAADADRALTLEERMDGPFSRSEVYDNFKRVTDDEVAKVLESFGLPTHAPQA